MNLSLPSFEQELLTQLCIRTGKSQEDAIKLAIVLAHQQFCPARIEAPAAITLPGPVYIGPSVTFCMNADANGAIDTTTIATNVLQRNSTIIGE